MNGLDKQVVTYLSTYKHKPWLTLRMFNFSECIIRKHI